MISIGLAGRTDPTYRYKMPCMIVKTEGKGNKARTAILNICDIAQSLKCEIIYLIRFFGIELGAQSKFDTSQNKATIAGFHNMDILTRLLDKFIELFILCPQCALPEISLRVHNGSLQVDCAACGHSAPLTCRHKLVTFLINNPPRPPRPPQIEAPETPPLIISTRVDEFDEYTSTADILTYINSMKNPAESFFSVILSDSPSAETFISKLQSYSDVLSHMTWLSEFQQILLDNPHLGTHGISILVALYDNDIITEDGILDWHTKTRATHPAILKFINWLNTADSE